MSSSNFVSWGGLAAVAGGALWMAVFALFASRPSGPGSAPPYRSFEGLYVPCLISTVLIVAGLVALHVHLRGTYGGLGTAGFVLALVGAALLVLVVGSLAFFLLDTEGWRVWFALPYGGAWVLVGYLLRSGGAGAPPRPTRVG